MEQLNNMEKYTSIVGNISSGKTTLCKLLGANNTSFEPFAENPFLKKFYEDMHAYCFETEISFLLQHYHEIKITKKLFDHFYCDYSICLDRAYARANLSNSRLAIFEAIADELEKEVGTPDRIIYLVCPEEVLLKRIISRATDDQASKRKIETTISIDYLKKLSFEIDKEIKKINIEGTTKVITIDSHKCDFARNQEDKNELLSFIKNI